MEGLNLTAEEVAASKRRAAYRLHVRQFPFYRLTGFAFVCLLVVLDTSPLVASRSLRYQFCALVLAYTLFSWLLLRAYFQRSRWHLGLLFLALDVPLYCAAIQLTGAEYSWYILLLIIRIADQIPAGLGRTLGFTHLSLACYLAMLASIPWRGGRVDVLVAAEKALILYLAGLYLSLSAVANQGLRRRASQALAMARGLILQLEQRTRELEEANQAKTRFLANTSHELRTPMNGIMGMLEVTLDSDLSEAQRENLSDAQESSRSLLRVLNDILDYSKIESGTFTLQARIFDPKTTITEVMALFKSRVKQKGLALQLQGLQSLPEAALADRDRLRQIAVNLVDNAIKFTESGSVTLQLHWDGYTLRLEVVDTGCGVAPEHLDRIFEAFVQQDGSLSRVYGGTGLGLAISRQLAQLMGGKLTAQSVPGTGSRFSLEIPMKVAAPLVEAGPDTIVRPSRKLSVLIVEDNLVNQKVCCRMVERCGHRAYLVADGAAALAAIENTPYDVILMDIQIPKMDGLEVTRRVRASEPPGRHVTIIALTAHATRGYRERCLDQGMDGFLEKPLQQSHLREVLDAVS